MASIGRRVTRHRGAGLFARHYSMPNLVLSILVAVIVTILLLAVLPISGGHMNPAISFSAALIGFISLSRAAI